MDEINKKQKKKGKDPMKKFLSILLAVAMIATMIPGIAVSAGAESGLAAHVDVGTGETYTDADNVVYTVIDSAQELLTYDGSKNIILAGNIDLNKAEITAAVATLASGVIIDGNGYAVTNFTMVGAADAKEFSLFDAADNANVTVRNITFGTSEENGAIGYEFKSSASSGYVSGGFLFAKVSCDLTVENVTVYASMTTQKVATGIIAGEYAGTLNLTNVKLYGTLSGVNSGNSAQGAFIARLLDGGNAALKNCENHVNVSATGGNKAGGFFGQTYLTGTVSFENCVNSGAVNTNDKNFAGGFIGQINKKTGDKYSFVSCVNRGEIGGASDIGGFVGNTDDGAVSFKECQNYGAVTGSGTTAGGYNFGGLIGNAKLPTTGALNLCFENCVNYGSVDGASNSGGGTGGMIGYLYLNSTSYTATEGVTFMGCLNYGTIGKEKTAQNAAGMVGRVYSNGGNTAKAITFNGCKNYGKITITSQQVGGLIGCVDMLKWAIDIKNSANFGDISGNQAGGAIGKVNQNGTASVTVTSFLNMGDLTSGSSAGGVLGIIWATAGTYSFDRCVNFGTVTGLKNQGTGGLVGGLNSNTPAFKIDNSMNAGKVSVHNVSGDIAYGNFVGTAGKASGSNNYYVAVNGVTNTDCVDTANDLQTLAKAIEKFNDGTSFKSLLDIHGKAMLNDNGNGAVLATPAFVGVQRTNALANDGTYSIRLVSVIDAARYSKVGYKLQLNGSTEKTEYCTTAYMEISETVNGKVNSYNASSLGGTYVYALNIDELDPNETYTFTVTTVAVGTVEDGAAEYIGESYTFTYANGVFTGYVESSEVQA